MKNKVILMPESQQKIAEGVETLYQAVSLTLGPTGKNTGISFADRYGNVYAREVLHDGVRIANSINLSDEAVNFGASVLQQAAKQQVSQCGDGTTVTIILGHAFYTQARKNIVAGQNPMLLRKDLEQGVKKLIAEIRKHAQPIKTLAQKVNIATVASEDPALGKIVADTITEIGPDGLVTVEPHAGKDTVVEKQIGMQMDKGYATPFFINNTVRMESILQDPVILVTDKKIIELERFKTLLEYLALEKKKLLIITPDIGEHALRGLVNNKVKGMLSSLVIKAPSFGPNQKAFLSDIAVFTGARFITEDANDKFEDVTIEDLGHAEYVTANKTDSLIVGGKGSQALVDERIASLRKSIELEKVDFDREKLRERLAKLTAGVAVIKVGGATEVEMLERVERVKDAVAATKAAMTHGIVPGGEIIFLQIREILDKSILAEKILYDALSEPYEKLISHAGLVPEKLSVDLYQCKLEDPTHADNYGVDVMDGMVKDMIKAGIIDPSLVPISALTNASSVAIQLFTTEALVMPLKDDNILQMAGI